MSRTDVAPLGTFRWFAELFPSLGVFDSNVQGAATAADQFGSQSSGGDVEKPVGDPVAQSTDFSHAGVLLNFHDV